MQNGSGDGCLAFGHNCANNVSPSAHSIHFGRDCLSSTTVGRLCFGNNMETPSVSNEWADAFIKTEWNGTLYYIPVRNDATVPPILPSSSSFSYTTSRGVAPPRFSTTFTFPDAPSILSETTIYTWQAPVDCELTYINIKANTFAMVTDFSGSGINGGNLTISAFKFPLSTNPTSIASRTDITQVLQVGGASIQSNPYGPFSNSGSLFLVAAGELVGFQIVDTCTDGGGVDFSWNNVHYSVTFTGT